MKSCAVLSLFLFCGFLALVGGAILLRETNPAIQAQRQADLLYRQERDRLDMESRRRQEQQVAELTTALLPFVKLAGAGLLVGVPLAAAGIGVSLLLEHRRRRRLVFIADGVPPLSFDRVAAGDYPQLTAMALAGHYAAEVERARNPVLPAMPKDLRTFNYAPRLGASGTAAPGIIGTPDTTQGATPVAVPTFADLLRLGMVGPGRPMVLGYTPDGAPLTGSLRDLYSVAIAGKPGSGKSNSEAFLAAQTIVQGGKLVVIDPHADADGSLASTLAPLTPAMLTRPASTDAEMVAALTIVQDELARRRAGAPCAVPWIVALDEWTSLVRRARVSPILSALVEAIAMEGRKLQIFAMVSGQVWNAESAGGTPLRDSLGSVVLHRMSPSAARLLVPGVGREVAELKVGQALLYRTSGDLVPVQIPLTTRQDLGAVVGQLPRPTDQIPLEVVAEAEDDIQDVLEAQESTFAAPSTSASATGSRGFLTAKARDCGLALSPEEWDILGRLDRGQSPHRVASDLAGASGGRPYTRKRAEVDQLQAFVAGWPGDQTWTVSDEEQDGDE